MRKRIYCILMTTILLLCSGCWINYDKLSNEEILVKAIKCSEEEAQNIATILNECEAGKIQNMQTRTPGTFFSITFPEGELYLYLNDDKTIDHIGGGDFTLYDNNEVLGTLIASSAETQYYYDTTTSMISSVQDMLVVTETFFGEVTGNDVEEPFAFDYDVKDTRTVL